MMSSDNEQEVKYTYRYTFVQERIDSSTSESSKAEIQAYINDVLGIARQKDKAAIELTV